MSFEDFFTNTSFRQHGIRKYSAKINDLRIGAVLATKAYSYDTYALNKPEFDQLLAAKRDGRLDIAVVIGTKTNGGNNLPTYCGEIDAERLEIQLTGVETRRGRFGEFYSLPEFTFAVVDAPF